MTFADTLASIEALAETGDLSGALARLEATRPGLPPHDASALLVLQGALTARTGDLDGSLVHLQHAEALAQAAKRPDVRLEASVTRASVLAAMGRYDDAIPLLSRSIIALRDYPELSGLLSDAQAELRSYRNLVSPKTLATWASLLG